MVLYHYKIIIIIKHKKLFNVKFFKWFTKRLEVELAMHRLLAQQRQPWTNKPNKRNNNNNNNISVHKTKTKTNSELRYCRWNERAKAARHARALRHVATTQRRRSRWTHSRTPTPSVVWTHLFERNCEQTNQRTNERKRKKPCAAHCESRVCTSEPRSTAAGSSRISRKNSASSASTACRMPWFESCSMLKRPSSNVGRCRSRSMSGTASRTDSHATMNIRQYGLTTKIRSRNKGMNRSTSNEPASVTLNREKRLREIYYVFLIFWFFFVLFCYLYQYLEPIDLANRQHS